MQNIQLHSQSNLRPQNTPPLFLKTTTLGDGSPTTCVSPLRKCSLRESEFNGSFIFSKNDPFHSCFNRLIQNNQTLDNESTQKAKHCLSLIEDPLWKYVCKEIVNMMGPAAVIKIWDSKLELCSSQFKHMSLYCQTNEIAQFIEPYSFVILGVLQQFFPALKELKLKTKQRAV